jgi:sugar phosphate permease
MLAAVYAVFSFSVYLLYTWLPTFLMEKFGLGLASAGFTATAYLNSGSVAGLLAGGWCADYFFRYTHASRPLVVAAAVCLAAPCIYAVGVAPSLGLTIAAATGFGVCTGMYMSNLLASAMDVVAPGHRSSATGFLNLVGAFFSGFAGLLGGIFKNTIGVDGLMIACAAACLTAGILLIAVAKLVFETDYQQSK